MTNYYKLEYDRQHPKRDITHLVLKIAALIIAVATVAIVSKLSTYADVILADAPYEDAAQSATEQANRASEQANKHANNLSEHANNASNNASEQVKASANAVEKKHDYSNIVISDEEYIELCQIVAAESQTQGLEGQKAVVEVIFNRVLSPEYPNTVHGVLSQRGQFATWRLRTAKWVEPYRAVDAIAAVVTNGRTVLPDTSYIYFDTKGINGRKHIKIQDHWFGAK